MPDPWRPGMRVTAARLMEDRPPTASDVQNSSYDADITTFGTGSTGGSYADCAVVFTAPSTGRVGIHLAGRVANSGSGNSLLTVEVREGAVIGSGTVVLPFADGRGVSHAGGPQARMGMAHLLADLAGGQVYNARMLHRVTSGTGTFALRELIVAPAT